MRTAFAVTETDAAAAAPSSLTVGTARRVLQR